MSTNLRFGMLVNLTIILLARNLDILIYLLETTYALFGALTENEEF